MAGNAGDMVSQRLGHSVERITGQLDCLLTARIKMSIWRFLSVFHLVVVLVIALLTSGSGQC